MTAENIFDCIIDGNVSDLSDLSSDDGCDDPTYNIEEIDADNSDDSEEQHVDARWSGTSGRPSLDSLSASTTIRFGTPKPIPVSDVRLDGKDHLPIPFKSECAQRCRQRGCAGRGRIRCSKCDVVLCLTAKKIVFSVFIQNNYDFYTFTFELTCFFVIYWIINIELVKFTQN